MIKIIYYDRVMKTISSDIIDIWYFNYSKNILYRKLSYIEREINISCNKVSIIHKLFLYIKLQRVNKNIEILHIVNYD